MPSRPLGYSSWCCARPQGAHTGVLPGVRADRWTDGPARPLWPALCPSVAACCGQGNPAAASSDSGRRDTWWLLDTLECPCGVTRKPIDDLGTSSYSGPLYASAQDLAVSEPIPAAPPHELTAMLQPVAVSACLMANPHDPVALALGQSLLS